MHVAIDAVNFNARPRGPDRYLMRLLEALARIDGENRYTVFYGPWQAHFGEMRLPERFDFRACEAPRNPLLRVLWHVLAFPTLVASVRPDLVHLPNLILAPRLDVPVVMTVHDLAHFRVPEKFGVVKARLQRWMIRLACRVPALVIAVSEFTRRDLRRFLDYPDARIRVIHEGGPEPRDVAPASDRPPYFLYVGKLERSKNVETLIQAFADSALLRDERAELWLAGDAGNAGPAIERLVEGVGDDRVRLLGFVDDAELPGLYAGALGFVFPSLAEGFGLVLLEAMAFGAPVIASDAEVLAEVVGDGGLLVDATDRDALRAAMERLALEPELRDDLRARGRRRLEAFSWDRAARETCDVYREALAAR